MTEHPDTITVAKCHPFRGDNFYINLPVSDRSGVKYIRADVVAANTKAHEKEIAVWAENYAALERQLAEAHTALIWCSGSDDFQEGGKARVGWLQLCAPILSALKGKP